MGLITTSHVITLHPALKAFTFANRSQIDQITWLQKFSAKNLAGRQTVDLVGFGKTKFLIMIKSRCFRWLSSGLVHA